ncbi:phosphatidylinositol phosphatase PTPRQ-like [Mercenaria mercenaria]|uniref:phosphatidylinositol phosphatase PTPRQ-like n=1 Tax=Mercenaria mercenaria TaxID=6596 RepID=UPI00234FA5DA|nr:phosphatidylinositol phosphatase PTPRQ-like [Mercenaria mercenaria]
MELNVNLAGLNFKLKTIGTNDIILCWRINPDIFEGSDYFSYVFVDVKSQPNDENVTTLNESRTAKNEVYDLSVNNLTPGTNYTFIYYVKSENGIPSKDKKQLSSYTRPLPPPQAANISKVTQHSFAITWKDDQNLSYSSYNIIISPALASLNATCDDIDLENGNCSLLRKENVNVTSLVFDGLAPGIQYSFAIYTSIAGLSSESGLNTSTYTIPLLPNKVFIPEDNISNNSLCVSYKDPASNFTHWSLKISNKHIPYTNTMMVPMNVSSVPLHDLQPGTEYNITLQTRVPGFYSINKTTLKAFTRPSDLHSIDIPKQMVHTTHFTVQYEVWDDMYDYFQFTTCNVSCITETQIKGILKKTIHNLTAATFYKIEAFAVKNTSKTTLKSKNPGTATSYSAPESPASVLDTVDCKNVTIGLSGNNNILFDYYKIQYNNKTEKIFNRTEERAVLSELTPGTEYTFVVYTVLTGIKSDGLSTITTFTRPGDVQNITAIDSTNASVQIEWNDTLIGHYDWFNVNATCRSPNNETNMNKTIPIYKTCNTSTILSDLDPGTVCNITIVSVIDNGTQLFGNSVTKVNTSSKESVIPSPTSNSRGNADSYLWRAAPEHVEISEQETDKRTLTVSWSKPLNPNGIVRKYQFLVVDMFEKEHCLKANYTYLCKHDVCKDDDNYKCQEAGFTEPKLCEDAYQNYSMPLTVGNMTFTQKVEHLHPYRNYSVTVRAYTKCWGRYIWKQLKTKTAVPAAPPSKEYINFTEDEIIIKLKPPKKEDANGVIKKFTIKYSWKNKTCWNSKDGDIVEQRIPCNEIDLPCNVTHLRPYWYYTINMSASTSEGEGPYGGCDGCYLRTKESTPGDIENLTVNPSAESANLSWSSPCRTNGILTKYTINLRNVDTNESWTNNTSSNETNHTIRNLLPYSNYTIMIAANTKVGPGKFAQNTTLQTKIDKKT